MTRILTADVNLAPARAKPVADTKDGLVWIPAGRFRMGSNSDYPEEAPAQMVAVDGFWIERLPVTNRRFAEFVDATGYTTIAEIAPDAAAYPGALPEMLKAGSLVFTKPMQRVDLSNIANWWQFMFGADWRHPYGPDSSLDGLADHPVVHVTSTDAEAFCDWAGMELPTEAEWEYAARGGLDSATYAWGDEFTPAGRHMANVWQGEFPWQSLAEDGYERTSPAGSFPANGYGLYDMIGNVWEWTADWYGPRNPATASTACCIAKNPRGGHEAESFDPAPREAAIPRRVLKGGSHLCAPNYCRRFRPAARHAQPIDSSTSHIGFRCIKRPVG